MDDIISVILHAIVFHKFAIDIHWLHVYIYTDKVFLCRFSTSNDFQNGKVINNGNNIV